MRRTCALSRAPDNAHTRRGFFDALGSDEVAARTALDFILEIYKVEERAKETGIAGTAEHLALRRTISRKVMDEFKAWLDAEKPKHLPKGPMGAAIGYALNQWETLTRFLDDARVPVDNNKAENALRASALGKKNWLFVGNDKAGENLAGLYSLVATSQANGANPAAYLRRRRSSGSAATPPPDSTSCCRRTGRRSQPSRRPEQGRRRSRTTRSDYPPALHRGREEIRVKRATGAIHDRLRCR